MSIHKKYRPVLTAQLINHILVLAKQDLAAGGDVRSAELVAKLSPFSSKIENGGIAAAYTARPRETLEESLGLTTAATTAAKSAYILGGITYATKEDYWEACYTVSLQHPEELSLAELQAAAEHKYINNLMSPEEEEAFESSIS